MNLILTTPVSFAQKTLAHRREGEGGEGERERERGLSQPKAWKL